MSLSSMFDKGYLFSTGDRFDYWYVYTVFFVLILVLSVVVKAMLKRRQDAVAFKPLGSQFYWCYLTFGILGLASTFMRYENLPIFGNRFLTFTILCIFALINVWLVFFYLKYTRKEVTKFHAKARKEKWLRKK